MKTKLFLSDEWAQYYERMSWRSVTASNIIQVGRLNSGRCDLAALFKRKVMTETNAAY